MKREETLCLIKPCTAGNIHLTNEIFAALLSNFSIIDRKYFQMTTGEAAEFYREHEGKDFYDRLIKFTTSGSLWAITLRGENAVKEWRRLAGATNPIEALPGTIRREFGQGMPNNSVHSSATIEDAKREIKLIFG